MATPTSACLRAAASLTGVAGHRDHLAVLLHELGQAQLVLGRHPAEHVQLGKPAEHFVVAQVLQFGAGDHAGPRGRARRRWREL
jgi:hypothetical protein